MAGGSIAKHYANITQTKITIGATSTVIVAKNPLRRYLSIQNISDETVYIGIGVDAVANEGTQIPKVGTDRVSSVEFTFGNSNLHNMAVNGICASGSKAVLVLEA